MKFKMYPRMFTENYEFNDKFEREMLTNEYDTLQDAINIAKETGIGLREQNWYVYKTSWLFGSKRISLKTLYEIGLFSKEISEDSISIYYNWK